jgi:hypothetical protein
MREICSVRAAFGRGKTFVPKAGRQSTSIIFAL